MKKRIVAACLALLMLFNLCGCSSSNKVVGAWKSDLGVIYVFEKDGTGIQANGFGQGNAFVYSTNGDVLTITSNAGGFEVVEELSFKIENNQLKLAVNTDGSQKMYMVYSKIDESEIGEISLTENAIDLQGMNNQQNEQNEINNSENSQKDTEDSKLIVGQWDGDMYSYVFNSDGTGMTYGFGGQITSQFTYQISNGYIYMTESNGGFETVEDHLYVLDGDSLRIAMTAGPSAKTFFVLTRSSNSSSETIDSSNYDLKIWFSELDGTCAASGTGAWSLSQEQMSQRTYGILKAIKNSEIKDSPNGNTIGVAETGSELGIFKTEVVSDVQWMKVHSDYDWWVNIADFETIGNFSDQ